MKLLLDENLSDRIVQKIVDLYPASQHVKNLLLTNTDDAIIWEYAKANNFVIVSKDADFHVSKSTLWTSAKVYLPPYWQQSDFLYCSNFTK